MAESLITKRAIADSLKELTKEKPFDKISVKDISEKCGINRQTFYYHFEDKYLLLRWIYQTDLLDKYMEDVDFDNWTEKLELLLTAMTEDKTFYVNTITHTGTYIQEYMIVQAQNIFEQAIDYIDETLKEMDVQRESASDEQRNFIARFFAYGACGMIVEWVVKGMEEKPSYVSENMDTLKEICEQALYDFLADRLDL